MNGVNPGVIVSEAEWRHFLERQCRSFQPQELDAGHAESIDRQWRVLLIAVRSKARIMIAA